MKSSGATAKSRTEDAEPGDEASGRASQQQPVLNPPSKEQNSMETGGGGEVGEEQTRIQDLAYQIYEERGRVDGQALDDWLEAESIVRKEDSNA